MLEGPDHGFVSKAPSERGRIRAADAFGRSRACAIDLCFSDLFSRCCAGPFNTRTREVAQWVGDVGDHSYERGKPYGAGRLYRRRTRASASDATRSDCGVGKWFVRIARHRPI